MQRHGAWKSASRHSAVRAVGRFTAKLTKRKFAFHHSGRRGVALIAAVSWHFGSTRASKSASHGPKHFVQEPARSTVFSAKPARSCEPSRALAQKPGTDHDFLGKFGADLCGPEHLAKNPFPQSRVFSAKQARTCADPSIQTRNLPRTTVLSAKQARTLLRAFGNYKGYNRNIPQLEQQAQHSVSLSRTKLSHCMGERGVRIK